MWQQTSIKLISSKGRKEEETQTNYNKINLEETLRSMSKRSKKPPKLIQRDTTEHISNQKYKKLHQLNNRSYKQSNLTKSVLKPTKVITREIK